MNKPHPCHRHQALHIILLVLWCLSLTPSLGWALTAANTIIRNQASATFKDDSGTVYNVTSNLVETLVQPVAGVELEQSQSKLASSGGTVDFPHVLTNTGNDNDSYTLTSAEVVGDSYDFTAVTFYADANQDGQPDNLNSPITSTPALKPGESFAFVAVATVPTGLVDGNAGKLTISGASHFTPTTKADNTDTAKVTSHAIVDVTKSLSATAGKAGSGNYTVTLRYENTSLVTATDVTLIDALPAGMEYVPGSGRWSETGSTALTDASPSDQQGTDPTIRYCAYDNSCTGVPEANRDADTNTTNQVTGIISEVGPGVSGELRFQVKISSGLPASILSNVGEYVFYDGTQTSERYNTNTVRFEVLQTAGVVTNGSDTLNTDGTAEPITVANATQNGMVMFHDYVWNTGNGTDSFDLTVSGSTFPAGTVFQFYHADGYTPLLDTNNNGTPDTGSLPTGTVSEVVIKAMLPPSAIGNNNGQGYQVTLNATSFKDATKTNPALNKLSGITVNSVDLTNDAALGHNGVAGQGPGPEATAVTTRNAMPGSTTRFVLYVNNTSVVADNFDLLVSTDPTFATVSIPDKWSIRFVDDTGMALANTGSITGGNSKQVFAEVTVPEDAATSVTELYFKAVSPVTAVEDIKHDALTVGEVIDLVLYPDNAGQILPGGTIIYSHWLTNQGNGTLTNITLNPSNDSDGWQALLYADTDDNGVLSGADQRISTIASLPVGQSKLIFAKVSAAATIPMGAANVTSITATWNNGSSSTKALDVTITNNAYVNIRKEQALDANCDGTEDAAFGHTNFTADPKQCVVYRLTATNSGAEQVLNVRIQDATPAYTSFNTAGGLPKLSKGSLAAPITQGSKGRIIGNVGTLDAGANATLKFGIKIE